jgi:branched-chain amino acid transport system substrate-binding protein
MKWITKPVSLLLSLSLLMVSCGTPEPTVIPTPTATGSPPTTTPVPTVVEDPWGVVKLASGEPLRLGVAVALTGDLAAVGEAQWRGVKLAIDEWGVIENHPIEGIAEDSACNEEYARVVAAKLAADPALLGVIGHTCSPASIAASEIYATANLLMISPSSNAAQLTETGLPTVFRTDWNIALQGAAGAEYVLETLGAQRAVVFHDGSFWWAPVAHAFVEQFTLRGGEVTEIVETPLNQAGYQSVLASEVTEVIFAAMEDGEDAALLARAMWETAPDALLFGGFGLYSDEYLDMAREAADGSFVVGIDILPGPRYDHWQALYQEQYGEEADLVGAAAYDATRVLLRAVESVSVVGEDGSLQVGRKALVDTVAVTWEEGATGTLIFDEHGDIVSAIATIYQVQNGDFVEVTAFTPRPLVAVSVLDAVITVQDSLRRLPKLSDDTKSLLLGALSDAAAALERSDGEGAIKALEGFASFVEERRKEIDNSVPTWPEIEGVSAVSEWLLSFAAGIVALGPSDILTTSPTTPLISRACMRKCLEDLALCLGISSGAILACGLGCLSVSWMGPQVYLGCVGVCVAIAGGTLSAVCAKQFLECIKACPP